MLSFPPITSFKMSVELDWDVEHAGSTYMYDVELTPTSATPSADADLPKKVEGKR